MTQDAFTDRMSDVRRLLAPARTPAPHRQALLAAAFFAVAALTFAAAAVLAPPSETTPMARRAAG